MHPQTPGTHAASSAGGLSRGAEAFANPPATLASALGALLAALHALVGTRPRNPASRDKVMAPDPAASAPAQPDGASGVVRCPPHRRGGRSRGGACGGREGRGGAIGRCGLRGTGRGFRCRRWASMLLIPAVCKAKRIWERPSLVTELP